MATDFCVICSGAFNHRNSAGMWPPDKLRQVVALIWQHLITCGYGQLVDFILANWQTLIEAVGQLSIHQNVARGLLHLFPAEQKAYPKAAEKRKCLKSAVSKIPRASINLYGGMSDQALFGAKWRSIAAQNPASFFGIRWAKGLRNANPPEQNFFRP